jgi:hypothetical protein
MCSLPANVKNGAAASNELKNTSFGCETTKCRSGARFCGKFPDFGGRIVRFENLHQ